MVKRNNKRSTRRNTKRNNTRRGRAPITARKKVMTYQKRSAFSQNRGSIVETKKQVSGVKVAHLSHDPNQQPLFLQPISFINYEQGIGENKIIGQSVFSKYYSMKLKFSFPKDALSIKDQYKIQLIHGWMSIPFGNDSTYSPLKNNCTRENLHDIQVARLKQNWNSSTDDMLFNDKEKAIFRIEGKQWVEPDLRHQIGMPHRYIHHTVSPQWIIAGGLPSVKKQLTWKPMRKLKLEYSSDSGDEYPTPFFYPNQSWIPFVCIYTPDFINTGTVIQNQVEVKYSDCHWYTDS